MGHRCPRADPIPEPSELIRLLDRLFRRYPPRYPVPIEACFDETLVYEGSIRTAADLFDRSGARPLPALVYRAFIFEYDGRMLCFQVRDDERRMETVRGRRHRAYLNTDASSVWFEGNEVRVFPRPGPETDEEE